MANEFARYLRKNMTDAEQRLWWNLRGEQFRGFKFRRQAPIGPFIADFVCFERKIVIELDGGQHASRIPEDETRTAWLNSQGFRVLRFWNSSLFEDLESVLETIWLALHTPHPNPPPQGGREPERLSG